MVAEWGRGTWYPPLGLISNLTLATARWAGTPQSYLLPCRVSIDTCFTKSVLLGPSQAAEVLHERPCFLEVSALNDGQRAMRSGTVVTNQA